MTTIASDGITVAADGLIVKGTERIRTDAVKVTQRGGYTFAATGHTAAMEPAIAWFLAGAKPADKPGMGWSLIVFHPDRCESYSDEAPYPDRYPYPAAFGTGAEYAMGAMRAGACPAKAVAIAADLDTHTGGTITELEVAGVSKVRPMKARA